MASFSEKLDTLLLRYQKVPLTQKIFFCENLRVMIRAGLSITEALNTLALQAESKFFRRIILMIKSDVESGKLLSQGLAKFPGIFTKIFISMVQIGEVSGTLDENLLELMQQMKKDYNLRSKVKGAMTYPIVILVAMGGITIGLLVFVLPKLLDIFKEFGDIQLPLPTRILIVVSDFVQAQGVWVGIGFVLFVIGFVTFSRTATGRSIIHSVLLRTPAIGPIIVKVNLARFSRTLAGLLKTDIPVVQSLTVTSEVLANVHYREAALDVAERIKSGETISSSLALHGRLFPPLLVQMVMVGERSGNVDSLLADVAEFYEQQVDNVLNNLSAIIEPILILFLGGAVGGIALAVMMPMYALTQAVSEQ
jgi:type IV pilus assembly protein PilC